MFSTILEILPCIAAIMFVLVVVNVSVFLVALIFTSYWYISLIYLAWYFYDREMPFRDGRPIRSLRKLPFWKALAAYFPAKLHKTADLDPSKNYIFAGHPHGMFVFGAALNIATNATGFDETFPGITMHMLGHDALFKIPFFRDIALFLGLESVSAESIDYKLTKMGPGHSVYISVGAGPEVDWMVPNAYTFKLKTRKGFIRRALKTGSSIVPVIIFNEHRLFDVQPVEKGSFWYYYEKFLRLFAPHIFPMNVRGRWWWSWLFVPKKLPLNTLVGAPIDFGKLKSFVPGLEPPEDLVDECHKIYLVAFRKLYHDNKARFGDENTPLILF